MKINFELKRFFFDKQVVIDHFGKSGQKTMKALSRAGAFIRTRARSMLRRRKAIAGPGQAPSVHTSDSTITLKNIQFAYDFQSSSLVVGPILTSSKSRASVPVPRLMELGGYSSIKGKTARYRPHPWMGPSLDAERSNLPAHWAAGVR